MENSKPHHPYYNIAGKYANSKRKFERYLKRELAFYARLHEQAIEKGACGIKIKPAEINFFGLNSSDLY